jgi:hypothetical protein
MDWGKGDRTRPRLDSWPILGTLCDPEDLYRMQRYSLERRTRDYVDLDDLHDAADRIFAVQQQELAHREHTVDVEDAVALQFVGWWVVDALRFIASDGYAKRRQLEHSNGRPLAVCMGGGKQRHVTTLLGDYSVQALGCFRVFEDSTRPSGRMWANLCPDCRHSRGQSLRRAVPLRQRQHALIAAARAAARSARASVR